jgi:glycosyltransferase involved in cell wall biosynthesis
MISVSVLTAAYNPNPNYLLEAYESLKKQNVAWQWVIQVDSTNEDIAAVPLEIIEDSRVVVRANGDHLGEAATRNLGLLVCEHDLIQNLDSDDILLPGALRMLTEALSTYPEAAFAFGKTKNLRLDGSLLHWQPAPYDYGLIEPGQIARTWMKTGRHHVTMAATMWRRSILHAFGGWGALAGREDLYLMLPVSVDNPVVYVDTFTLHYREHLAQTTRKPGLQGVHDASHQALCAYRLLARRVLTGEVLNLQDYYYIDEHSQEKIMLPPL